MKKNIYVAVLIVMILLLSMPVMANTSNCSNEYCLLGDNSKRNSLKRDCSNYAYTNVGNFEKNISSEESIYDTDAPRKIKKTIIK